MPRRPPCPPDKDPLIWDMELQQMEDDHLRLLVQICVDEGRDFPKPLHEPASRPRHRESLPRVDRFAIMLRDHFTCYICGKADLTPDEIHIDHIKPLSRGGVHDESNMGVTCKPCNLQKSDTEYAPTMRPKALLNSVTPER